MSPVLVAAALGAVLALTACDTGPTACPAIAWSNGLTVELAGGWWPGEGRSVRVACPQSCGLEVPDGVAPLVGDRATVSFLMETPDSVALAWFAGPPRAEPDELRLRTDPVVTAAGEPIALWDPATGTLAVVAESPAVTARVLDGTGGSLAELPLSDGLAVQAAPEGTATVEVLAADGTVLASVEPLAGRAG